MKTAATDPGFLDLRDEEEHEPTPLPPSLIAKGFVDFLKENTDDGCFVEVFDQVGAFEEIGEGSGGGEGDGEWDVSMTAFSTGFEGGKKQEAGGGGGGPLGNDPGGGSGGGPEGRIPDGGGGGRHAVGGRTPGAGGGGGGGGATRTSHRFRPLLLLLSSSPPCSDFLFLSISVYTKYTLCNSRRLPSFHWHNGLARSPNFRISLFVWVGFDFGHLST